MKYINIIGLILIVGCSTYRLVIVEPKGKECEYDFYNSKTGEHKLITDTCNGYEIGDKWKK